MKRLSLVIVCLFLCADGLKAGLRNSPPFPSRDSSPTSGAYGAATGVLVIGAHQFSGFADSTQYTDDNLMNVYSSDPTAILIASVMLPSGAKVTGIELQGCDDGASQLEVGFFSRTEPNVFAPYGGVATSGTPGCGYTFAPLPDIVIDNAQTLYSAAVFLGGGSAIRFSAVRIFYQRQVSPGPGVATFADVPTNHGFFKFVEALAAAGITGGCGGGNFCPNTAVTRGQMAVFLSTALGLHWAP